MRRLWSQCGQACFLLVLILCHVSVGRAQVSCTDLGQFPGFGISAMNASGQIVGSFPDANNKTHGLLLSGGGFTRIDVPGAQNTYVNAINASGQIVGFFEDAGYKFHGFLLSGGNFTTIDAPGAANGTLATAINDSGQIAGYFSDAVTSHGFLLSGGNFTTIDAPGAANGTLIYWMNNNGQMVGYYFDAAFVLRGFLLSAGIYTTIYPPAEETFEPNFHIYGMNASGEAVGEYTDNAFHDHGFLFSGGSYTNIDDLGVGAAVTYPAAINASGQIAGDYQIRGDPNPHAFLLSGGSYTTINCPGAIKNTEVSSMNDSGQMAGFFVDATNGLHIFLASIPITLVDPVASFGNPSLVDDHGIINKPDLLAASKQTVQGVAADGTTQVVVRVPDKGGNAGDVVTLTVLNDLASPTPSTSPEEDGYFSSLDGKVTKVNTITATTVQSTAGSPDLMAFVIYHAPKDFVRPGNPNDPGATQRAVTIQIQVQNQDSGAAPVLIVRPPVALIHGLWSSRTTWDFFAPLVLPNEQYDARFQGFRIDYEEHNSDYVNSIVNAPGGPFDQLASDLADFKTRLNVAAIQFDFVVHSMGGLVTRDMALNPRFKAVQNYNQGIVHKLITIGTPHNGSPIVNELNQSSSVCKFLFGKFGRKIAGAMVDLSVGSSFLATVNQSASLPLKAHAIVGIANVGQESASELGLGKITQFVCSNILPFHSFQLLYRLNGGSGNSDLLVPQESQAFGFFPASTIETISDSIHTVGPIVFPEGPDELNRVLSFTETLTLNPMPTTDPTIDPNRVINGLNTPISDATYWTDIKP